jgi:rubrerythrin
VLNALTAALETLRSEERAQAMYYRRLAALAEEVGDAGFAQRLHDLHADEQHHVSRLTARLVELGHTPRELERPAASSTALEGWESEAKEREHAEVERYETFLRTELDPLTRALAEGILEVEKHHRDELAGKWTVA